MDPVVLGANQPPDRFYLGGARIAEFRGVAHTSDRVPEDWVASTTTLAGESRLGLSPLPDGRMLRDAIAQDPIDWLGAAHVDRFGVDTKLLVKLLHAGQRLPVHAHPPVEFAHRRLRRAHGKAEAWLILSGGEVHLGLRDDISRAELHELVTDQDTDTMLSLLHRRPVAPGDTVYVPPGALHAIGSDVFLAEVQEPEDLSILLEWRDFELDGAADGHLGLGFPTALQAVDLTRRTESDISALITSGRYGDSVLPEPSGEFFRAGRYRLDGSEHIVDPGFLVMIVTDGQLQVAPRTGSSLPARRGVTMVVPHACGEIAVSGRGEVLVLRPPAAAAPANR